MTPELTDPLAVELIELMLKSWPQEKDELWENQWENQGGQAFVFRNVVTH